MTPMFRYFLGFQVAADRAGWLARHLPHGQGDLFAGLKPQLYHLTLCTIAETHLPHPFLRQRVATALETGLPTASPIPFGRIVGGDTGARLTTTGSVADIRCLYSQLAASLERHDIHPLHRLSGLHPHITLGYGKCEFDPVPVAWTWTPRDLVLIESHIGHRRHRVLRSWTLEAPAQAAFGFMDEALPPPLRRAA